MTRKRQLIHAVFVFVLPILVAAMGAGVLTALVLVAAALLWRWLIVLSGITAPEAGPDVVLETISASHYVEKVRWCMDRMELDYTERQTGGTLGVFFTGRTVPLLRVRTGLVESVIGNSPEILRFLWGAHAARSPEKASFLEPTVERLELEGRLDRYGRNLQVWVYYHLLDHRELTLQAWGANSPAVPVWQRQALRVIYPVLVTLIRRAFAITDENYTKAVMHIEELLSEIDTTLADGRGSILGGEVINYTDLTFAALSGLWLQPENYGGGKADATRIERDLSPAAMRDEVERWSEDFRKATEFVERLYEEER
jgi:glutathione S-transferase